MSEEPTFKIPKDVIEPIIQAHVSAAVVAALADRSRLVEQVVAEVLNRKVDKRDGSPTHSDYQAVPWLEWVMKECVRKAVKETIEQEMPKHDEAIRAAILRELGKGGKSPLVRQLITGMTAGFTQNLHWKLNVTIEEDKRS